MEFAVSKITPRDIDLIAELFEAADWNVLELRVGTTELFLSKRPGERASWGAASSGPESNVREVPVAENLVREGTPLGAGSAVGASSDTPPPAAAPARPHHHMVVPAPSLGTFYRAPKPGAPPFVEVGDGVTPDTELCLIEVMKLFTTLQAGVTGTVLEVLASDGAMIELGQPLFVIDTRD
jgi:acetyl-CoA carboxylase biotin carboxyl carrier protein